jgi:hypothetical protein
VKIASNFSDAFNALLEGYLSIGDHIPLLVQYRQLFETNQYMQTALASIFEDVLEFHLEAVKLFRQRSTSSQILLRGFGTDSQTQPGESCITRLDEASLRKLRRLPSHYNVTNPSLKHKLR